MYTVYRHYLYFSATRFYAAFLNRDDMEILLRHLLEGSCEITVRMHASVRYVGRASTAGLLRQLTKSRGKNNISLVRCALS